MPATYDTSLATVRDRMRLALGDTDMDVPLLSDEEYDGMYAHQGMSEPKTLIALARALIVRFAQQPTEVDIDGGVAVKWAERLAAWRELIIEQTAILAALTGTVPVGFTIRRPDRFYPRAEYYPDRREALET